MRMPVDRIKDKSRLCWIDNLFGSVNFMPWPLVSVLAGSAIYLLSITPLIACRRFDLVFEPGLFIGAIGVSWVLVTTRFVTSRYEKHVGDLMQIVSKKDAQIFLDSFNKAKSLYGHDFATLSISFLSWVLLAVAVCLVFYGVWDRNHYGYLYIFSDGWYDNNGNTALKVLSLLLVGAPVFALISTTGWLIIVHTIFVAKLSTIDFSAPSKLLLNLLKPILNISLIASVSWGLGILMFAQLFSYDFNEFKIYFISPLVLIGGVGLGIPGLFIFYTVAKNREKQIKKSLNTYRQAAVNDKPHAHILPTLYDISNAIDEETKIASLTPVFYYYAKLSASLVAPIATKHIIGILPMQDVAKYLIE